MKEVVFEISPEGGNFRVGNCEINVPSKSVQEVKKVTLKLDLPHSRDGYLPASGSLICEPPVSRFRKHVGVKIPIWYTPLNPTEDMELPVCTENCGEWNEIDSAALTDEKYVEIQLKELDNITVFLPNKLLPHVQLHAKSYLFLSTDTSLKIAIATDDEVMESALISRMEKSQHRLIRNEANKLPAFYGDEMEYYFSDKDKKKDDEVTHLGQIVVDENFLQNPIMEIATYDLKASPFETSTFAIRHYRTEQDERRMIDEDACPLEICSFIGSNFHSQIRFKDFRCENFISSASNVHIDQRTVVDEDGKTLETKKCIVEKKQPALQVGDRGSKRPAGRMGNFPGMSSSLIFDGNVTVNNFVSQAKDVVIDQRKIVKKRSNVSKTQETLINAVAPEEEEPFPVQVDGGGDAVQNKAEGCDHLKSKTFDSPQGCQDSSAASDSHRPARSSNDSPCEDTKP